MTLASAKTIVKSNMRTRPTGYITPAEMKVFAVIRKKPATTEDIAKKVYGSSRRSHYASTQMLLGRLERKGFVKKDVREKPFVWSSRSPVEILRMLLKNVAAFMGTVHGNGLGRLVSEVLLEVPQMVGRRIKSPVK